ncbi:Dolichol-phosphate mannosyltransferase subunit 3 [Trebouxia sp. C0009 RCD-2024]
MLRIYRFAGGLLGLIAVWVAALRSDLQPDQYLAVLLAPVFFLALFGLYSVTSLIYGVVTFRTVPEEATALRQDIADARKDLQAHNIS